MRIALTTVGKTLDASMDARFGRCPYFLLVDAETLAIEAIKNTKVMLGANAGMEVVRLLESKGVTVVLTIHCGPNAFLAMAAAGIKVFTGCDGRAGDCLESLLANRLQQATSANAPRHYGLGLWPRQGEGEQ